MSRLLDDKQLEAYKKFVPGHTAAEIANMVYENWGIQLTVQKVHALNIRNNIKSGLYQKYFGKADPRSHLHITIFIKEWRLARLKRMKLVQSIDRIVRRS